MFAHCNHDHDWYTKYLYIHSLQINCCTTLVLHVELVCKVPGKCQPLVATTSSKMEQLIYDFEDWKLILKCFKMFQNLLESYFKTF